MGWAPIQGLAPSDEDQIDSEVEGFAGFGLNDYETAKEALQGYPKLLPIETLGLSPLNGEKFEPEYFLPAIFF